MKVLLLTSMQNSFHAGYYYLIRELAKHEQVTCYTNFDTRRKLFPVNFTNPNFAGLNVKFGKGWHKLSKRFSRSRRIRDIKRLSENFDVAVVIENSFFAQVGYDKDAGFIQCPSVDLIADVHLGYGDNLNCLRKSGFDLVLFVYKWWMDRLKGKVASEVGWLPHSVNTDVFRDYGLPKKYDVVSAGMCSEAYPLRSKMQTTFSNDPAIRFCMPVHPQFTMNRPRFCSDYSGEMIRENYARFLNESKTFAFCSSIHNYPLAKYVEGMACGTLVLAPLPKDADALGFASEVNFVSVDESDFYAKAKWFLSHPEERAVITRQAREMVERLHSTKVRVEELRRFLREL